MVILWARPVSWRQIGPNLGHRRLWTQLCLSSSRISVSPSSIFPSPWIFTPQARYATIGTLPPTWPTSPPPNIADPLSTSILGDVKFVNNLRSAIIQAVQELPIMSPDEVKDYAEKEYTVAKELCGRGEDWQAVTPWLKALISGMVYPTDIDAHEQHALKQCITPTLNIVHHGIMSIFTHLAQFDRENDIAYNLNILSQFSSIAEEANPDISYSEMRERYENFVESLNLQSIEESTRLAIESSDIPVIESLRSRFSDPSLSQEANVERYARITVGELRKACLLLFSGKEGEYASARYFASALASVITMPAITSSNIDHEDLLYIYQKQLPASVFERILKIVVVDAHNFRVQDDKVFRAALIQAVREMPRLTPEAARDYSSQCFDETQAFSATGSENNQFLSVVSWLKGFICGIFYSSDVEALERLAKAAATTPTLDYTDYCIRRVLRKLLREAPEANPPFTLGIIEQFGALNQEAIKGIKHDNLRTKYTDAISSFHFANMDQARKDDLKKVDAPVFEKFFVGLPEFIQTHSEIAGDVQPQSEDEMEPSLIERLSLIELTKACLLIVAGGDCVRHATPYLANTFVIVGSMGLDMDCIGLIYVYQQILPASLFERFNQFVWMFLHSENKDEWLWELPLPSPPAESEDEGAEK